MSPRSERITRSVLTLDSGYAQDGATGWSYDEVLPYFKDWEVAPWHLLEAGHKNFFTRASLRALLGKYFARVEVFSYGEHPLRTRDQIALHLHLFAVAESFRAAFGT